MSGPTLKLVDMPGETASVSFLLRKFARLADSGEIPMPEHAILIVEREGRIDVYGMADVGDATRAIGVLQRAIQTMALGLAAEAAIKGEGT